LKAGDLPDLGPQEEFDAFMRAIHAYKGARCNESRQEAVTGLLDFSGASIKLTERTLTVLQAEQRILRRLIDVKMQACRAKTPRE
jgi:hypothetical protein